MVKQILFCSEIIALSNQLTLAKSETLGLVELTWKDPQAQLIDTNINKDYHVQNTLYVL